MSPRGLSGALRRAMPALRIHRHQVTFALATDKKNTRTINVRSVSGLTGHDHEQGNWSGDRRRIGYPRPTNAKYYSFLMFRTVRTVISRLQPFGSFPLHPDDPPGLQYRAGSRRKRKLADGTYRDRPSEPSEVVPMSDSTQENKHDQVGRSVPSRPSGTGQRAYLTEIGPPKQRSPWRWIDDRLNQAARGSCSCSACHPV